MKLNELVCPRCGLKCMTDAAYTTCASCSTFFYANQSRSVDYPMPVSNPGITIVWPPNVQPTIYPAPNPPGTWVTVGDFPPCGSTTTGIISTDQSDYQVWN